MMGYVKSHSSQVEDFPLPKLEDYEQLNREKRNIGL